MYCVRDVQCMCTCVVARVLYVQVHMVYVRVYLCVCECVRVYCIPAGAMRAYYMRACVLFYYLLTLLFVEFIAY